MRGRWSTESSGPLLRLVLRSIVRSKPRFRDRRSSIPPTAPGPAGYNRRAVNPDPSQPRPEVRCRGEVVWSQEQDGSGRLCEAGIRLLDLSSEAAGALDTFARQPIDRRR